MEFAICISVCHHPKNEIGEVAALFRFDFIVLDDPEKCVVPKIFSRIKQVGSTPTCTDFNSEDSEAGLVRVRQELQYD